MQSRICARLSEHESIITHAQEVGGATIMAAAATPSSSATQGHESGSDSGKGRPRHPIDQEQLRFLRSLHFSWEDIAAMLGTSAKTVQRRAKEWNITTFSEISDSDLDQIVSSILAQFPCAGEVMLRGHLQSLQVQTQRQRLRTSIRRITVEEGRGNPPIHHRTYSVPGTNALWHVDGNHKLIRWRLVIHGGIDGFSRLITYLQCSNNNRCDTVTECFISATREYGVPSHVRSDRGG